MRKAEKLFFPSAIVPGIEKQKKHSFRTFSIFIGDSRSLEKTMDNFCMRQSRQF